MTRPRIIESTNPDLRFWFDETEAARAAAFFPAHLRHVEGPAAGRRFHLEEWQESLVRELFGWRREVREGRRWTRLPLRRYKTLYLEIPKKNGKSTFGSGLALYALHADREPSALVVSAAADRLQAGIIFRTAQKMVLASPTLKRRTRVFRRHLETPTWGEYQVLSADARTKHGLNASLVLFDELHTQPNRLLYDTLRAAGSARAQPLFVMFTTAGYDTGSICYAEHEYARQILNGTIIDPTYLAVIYAADPEEDWTDPAVQARANPNLGVSVNADTLREDTQRAIKIPSYQNTFKRLHLNIWTASESRWIGLDKWDACGKLFDPTALFGRVCYAGLDLAGTSDLAAYLEVYPVPDGDPAGEALGGTGYYILPWFWLPAEGLIDRERRDGATYDLWRATGFLSTTPGEVIDYQHIRHLILARRKAARVREIAFDRWGAPEMATVLADAGMTVIPFGQGFGSMGGPVRDLIRLVTSRGIRHGGHPVLRWMADNAVIREDPSGNLKFDRAKSTKRIDGIVALVMGLDRALRQSGRRSVYSQRGLLST